MRLDKLSYLEYNIFHTRQEYVYKNTKNTEFIKGLGP